MGYQYGTNFHNIPLLGKTTFWGTAVLNFSMVLWVVSICGSLCEMLLGGCVSVRVLVDSLECCYRLDCVLIVELFCDTSECWDFKKLIDSECSWGQGLMGGISIQVRDTASFLSRIIVRSSHLLAERGHLSQELSPLACWVQIHLSLALSPLDIGLQVLPLS